MDNRKFMLPKKNVLLIVAGFVFVVLGYVLMTGPATVTDFNPDVFSTRRIVVAPMVSLAGLVFIVFAILYKRKNVE